MNKKIKSDFTKESDFQKWAQGVLDKIGVKWYHIPAKNKYVKKGIPDLLCWYRGRFWAMELKVGKNSLSGDQLAEVGSFNQEGFTVYPCWNKEEFLSVLSDTNILKGAF